MPRFQHPVSDRLRYILTPMAIVDLLAVLPFYLPLLGVDLRSLRILHVFRIFRVVTISRYISAMSVIASVFWSKKEELSLSIIFAGFLLVIVSAIMYYVENAAQPETFSSILLTMWWGIATLTTVGYGDMYPVTPLGHLLGGAVALIGIGLFALPTGILASGFSDELSRRKMLPGHCPTCGRPTEQE